MLAAYLGALALGAGVLGLQSVLGHGHGGGVDLDGDGIPDVAGGGHDGDHDGLAFLGALASLRFWTFFLLGMGLVGTAATLLAAASSTIVFVAALGVGVLAGFGAVFGIKKLEGRSSSSHSAMDAGQGRLAKVIVRIEPERSGKVRVELKGQLVDLVARSDETFAEGDEVVVTEVVGHEAKVSRFSNDDG